MEIRIVEQIDNETRRLELVSESPKDSATLKDLVDNGLAKGTMTGGHGVVTKATMIVNVNPADKD